MSQAAQITQGAAARDSESFAAWLRPDYLIALVSFLILGFFIFLSTLETTPPATVPSSAPPTEFSSGRAMQHLGVIAQKTHPPGTAEHSAVRDYILKELTAMGLKPEIQKAAQSLDHPSHAFGAVIENIIARLPGAQSSGKAVLMSAHYDTVPHSTGASDNAAGVATLLETLRTLRTEPQLANDIIFLFTDGEEIGLLGARAFVEKHPAAKDVKVALNFDALGKSGATIMFESTGKNEWIIGELAKAAPNPVANSLADTIYERLPYITDLEILATDGIQGLNFAYLDGVHVHHTQLDSLETIDERSVQHMGTYALALARHFGNINLEPAVSRDAIFFSVLGSFLVHYPVGWAIPLTIVVAALFIAVVVVGLKRKRLTLGGMVLGVFAFLFSVIASAIVVSVLQKVTGILPNESLLLGNADPYNSPIYFLGFVAVAIAVISALYIWFRGRTSSDNLIVGAMIPWLILTIFIGFALPTGSYLFTWPLLFILIAQGADFLIRKEGTDRLKIAAGLSLATFPAIVLIVPMLYFLFQFFSFQMTPRITAILITVVMLPVSLLISQIDLMLKPNKWLLPAVAILVGIAFLSVGKFTSRFDRDSRMRSSLFYAVNANTGSAMWASLALRPDEWTRQFLTDSTERTSALDFVGQDMSVLSAAAPAMQVPGPDVKVVSDTTNNGIRTLNLRIKSGRQAPCIIVSLNEETIVRAFVLDGKRYDQYPKDGWRLRYFAVPPEGMDLVLEIEQQPNIVMRVTDFSPGLPQLPGVSFTPRPDHLMISSELFNDGVIITKTIAF